MFKFISVFDLDHTLLKENCSYSFGSFLYKKGILSFPKMCSNLGNYALHKGGIFSIERLHKKIFETTFKLLPKPFFQTWATKFLEDHLETLINQNVLDRLYAAQKEGHFTAILSGSPDFLVCIVAKHFKVNTFRATEYTVDREECFHGISSVLDGFGKANFLRKIANQLKIDLSDTYAYSDSYLDIPFLEIAGKAIGVNPDKKLKKICKSRAWEIIL